MTNYITSRQIIEAVANTPQIVFETTDACNLNCKYCLYGELYSSYGERHARFLSSKLAILFLDSLFKLWESNIVQSARKFTFISFYGGEPLLNMSFIKDVVSFVNQKKMIHDFGFTMTTNGILLDKHIDFFVENQFDILVSLDGNEFNNSYRVYKNGEPSFNQLTKNLEYIRDTYPDYFDKCISFNAVLHDRNSIQEIVDFFKSNYGKIPTIGEMNPTGVDSCKRDTFNKMFKTSEDSFNVAEQTNLLLSELGSKAKLYKSLHRYVQCYSSHYFESYLDLLRDKDLPKLPTGTCIPFSKKIFITVNGEILPCERIPHNFIMGKIDEANMAIDYEKCAMIYNTLLSRMERLCEKCYNKRGCIQCAYNLCEETLGTICDGFMNRKTFLAYEKSIISFLSKHPDIYANILNKSVII